MCFFPLSEDRRGKNYICEKISHDFPAIKRRNFSTGWRLGHPRSYKSPFRDGKIDFDVASPLLLPPPPTDDEGELKGGPAAGREWNIDSETEIERVPPRRSYVSICIMQNKGRCKYDVCIVFSFLPLSPLVPIFSQPPLPTLLASSAFWWPPLRRSYVYAP